MEIQGKVIAVLAAQSGTSQRTGAAWMSQEFVIEIPNGQYSRKALFKLFGEQKIGNAAPNLVVGKEVVVSFDVNASEYNGRWYNSLDAWKVVDAALANQQAAAPAPAQPAVSSPAPPAVPQTATAAPQQAQQSIPAPTQSNGDELPF